jgi:hypothetical protein
LLIRATTRETLFCAEIASKLAGFEQGTNRPR